jgi:hypothetical protein
VTVEPWQKGVSYGPEATLDGEAVSRCGSDASHQRLLMKDGCSMMGLAWWGSLAHEGLSQWLEV